nr:PREDICTED: pyridoxal phosphate phosphatase [Struthio camelus australis]
MSRALLPRGLPATGLHGHHGAPYSCALPWGYRREGGIQPLRKRSQCLLVATDPDPWHPLSDGQRTPGTGSLTAAVETASGRKALVVGKPNTYMFDCIVERFGVDPSRTLMVGDRLETDILFGKNCGLSTILTLTGVSRLEEAQAYMASDSAAAKDLVPNYYVDSIADLIPGLDD